MSDVEGDLEFYTAFEDELYKETGSVNSDDDIDSELEAELYQNVHFASTFVVTPSSNVQEETDDPNKDEVIASSPVEEKLDSVDGKPASDSPCFTDGVLENGIAKYPEVELVFSNDKKKVTESKCKKDGVTPVSLFQSLDGVKDAWELHEADLTPAKSVNSKEKKRRSYVRCFNCNERGHRIFQCTQPKKEKVCCLCGLSGHIKQECPNELCFNCHEPGHQLRQCRKARCRLGDTCRRCHAYGHFESICPDKWRQYHHTIKQGNVIQPGMQLKPLQNKVYCYNCGAEGHLGHECVEDNPDGRFADAFPFVAVYDRFTSCPSAVNNRHEQQDQRHTPNQNHHHHTPNQNHHTPNQNHHTPNQNHHTPNQNHHTSNQTHHTPNQNHHTPNQNHHTPNQQHHTLNRNRRQNHNQHQTQHHDQKNSRREHLNGNNEKRSKRRKVEDHWGYQDQAGDQGWGYSRDNWNTMEEDVNRLGHWGNLDFTETPELKTSFECDISPIKERKGKRKRKIKEATGMLEVTLTEDSNRNGNKRNKKRKRKIEQGQNQEDLRTVINTWNTAPIKKRKKNKNKKAKLNQDGALPPFKSFNPPPPAFHLDHSTASSFPRNQEKSFIQQNKRKRKESKKLRKSKNEQTAKANNSRRVYYDFNGFV